MPHAYSLHLRERVLAAVRADHLSPAVIAARFCVGASTVRGWLRRARETGSVAAQPHGGGVPPKVDAAGAPVLRALVAEENTRTLDGLAARYAERTGTRLSLHAVRRACQRLDVRRKRISYAASEQAREDVAAARAAWRAAAPTLTPEALVFVDASGVATNMAPVRARRGRPARGGGGAPGQWERLTIQGGLTLAGLTACLAVEGATDTAVMRAFVERAGAHAPSRAGRGARQPRGPQGRASPGARRGGRLPTALPAAVLAGLQSHRAGVE